MAWTTAVKSEWPPVAGSTHISAWDYISQLWKAAREREAAIEDTYRWPRGYFTWGSGTIDSIVDDGDTITLTSTDHPEEWMVNPADMSAGSTKRWVAWDRASNPEEPFSYDVIIEVNGPNDHEKIIHVQITDNAADTLTVGTWVDWVTAGWIGDVEDVVGKPFWIIKRDGWWHHERWPLFPNSREHWSGIATAGTIEIDEVSHTTIADDSIGTDPARTPWAASGFTGMDVVYFGTDNRMHRAAIVGNDTRKLWIEETVGWTPSGKFVIVASGAKCWAGRSDDRFGIFQWYYGALQETYSHLPSDSLGTVGMASTNVIFNEIDGFTLTCEPFSHNAFDLDVWSDVTNPCNGEENFSRYLYATIRGLQVWIQDRCISFVPPAAYDGAKYIPLYTFATLMHSIGVNSGLSVVDGPDGDDNYFITVDPIYEGKEIYWTIRYDADPVDGVYNWTSGGGTVVGGKVIVGETPADDEYLGSPVTYTAGWTRYYPRMLRRPFYPSGTVFIPDVDEGNAVDPPTIVDYALFGCFGKGTWTARETDQSTTYMIYNSVGLPSETTIPFVEGELARYVGDNWADGLTGDTVLNGDTPYFEHFYVGQRRKTPSSNHQQKWETSLRGVVTSSTVRSITDNTKQWWSVNWYHQSVSPGRPSKPVIRIESGVATGGGGSTLIDTTKIDDIANEPGSCWWKSERFSGLDPWVGFILEVDEEVDDGAGNITTVTHKAPITASDNTTGTITFIPSGFSVAAGQTYRIREPAYHLNQFKGRQLLIRQPSGATITATITHNDYNTLWFDALDEAPQAGYTFDIIERQTGGVWQWDGSEWVLPEGVDSRGGTFRSDPRCNLPTKVKDYGRYNRGDYVTMDVLTEIYNALNKMIWTLGVMEWTSDSQPNLTGGEGGPALWPDAVDDFNADWAAKLAFAIEDPARLPGVNVQVESAALTDNFFITGERSRSKGLAQNIPTTLSGHDVDFYAFARSIVGITYTFNNYGDAVVEDAFNRFDTVGPESDATALSDWLGAYAVPPPNIPQIGWGSNAGTGYRITNQSAIIRWDVTGGMEYISPVDGIVWYFWWN